MKTITEGQFRQRMLEIQKARRIFVETGLTANITHAFTVYQELLAEEEMPVHVSTDVHIQEECPACGTLLRLTKECCSSDRIIKECKGCGWKSY